SAGTREKGAWASPPWVVTRMGWLPGAACGGILRSQKRWVPVWLMVIRVVGKGAWILASARLAPVSRMRRVIPSGSTTQSGGSTLVMVGGADKARVADVTNSSRVRFICGTPGLV